MFLVLKKETSCGERIDKHCDIVGFMYIKYTVQEEEMKSHLSELIYKIGYVNTQNVFAL